MVEHFVNEFIDDSPNQRLSPTSEQLGSERRCHQIPMGSVLGFVHCEDRVGKVRTHDVAQDLGRKPRMVTENLDDLVEAEHAGRLSIRATVFSNRQRPAPLHSACAPRRREIGIGVVHRAPSVGAGDLEGVPISHVVGTSCIPTSSLDT